MRRSERCDAGSSPAPGSKHYGCGDRNWLRPRLQIAYMRVRVPSATPSCFARVALRRTVQSRMPSEALAKEGHSVYWGQHKGADDPCKIVVAGALPAVSTNSSDALVAQRTERRASTSGPCGFESCRGLHMYNGGLAERKGTALLTRRDLRVAQVRSLHPPPSCSARTALRKTAREADALRALAEDELLFKTPAWPPNTAAGQAA